MKRLAKPYGRFNVIVEDAPKPDPGPGEVRIRAVCSLISPGSEIGDRYTREEAVDPQRMGYSLAGMVDAVGDGIHHLRTGDRVVALAPHAEFVVRSAVVRSSEDMPWVVPLPDSVPFDRAPYYPLVCGAVSWVEIEETRPDDVVVILGQGLVGVLMLQVAKTEGCRHVVAVDVLDSGCELAAKLGADHVINAARDDPVAAVRRLTNGLGADVVAYAVGGKAGPRAFEQGLDMLAPGGLIHLIGLYEGVPLPLHSGKIQGKRLIGGYYRQAVNSRISRRALDLLGSGAIRTDLMTTHRFHYTEGPKAYELLYNRPGEALGVLIEWDR